MSRYIYLADSSGILLTDSLGVFLVDASSVKLQLITDRTAADVEHARLLSAKGLENMTSAELEECLSGLKGAYNASDLNRVESAVQYLVNRMFITGNNPFVDVKTAWTNNEWVTENEATRYLHNIEVLRKAFVAPSNMPEVPQDLNDLTYQDANNIELILEMIDTIITNISKTWYYSGDIYAGEV